MYKVHKLLVRNLRLDLSFFTRSVRYCLGFERFFPTEALQRFAHPSTACFILYRHRPTAIIHRPWTIWARELRIDIVQVSSMDAVDLQTRAHPRRSANI